MKKEEARALASQARNFLRYAAEVAGIEIKLGTKYLKVQQSGSIKGYRGVLVRSDIEIPLNGQREEIVRTYVQQLQNSGYDIDTQNN